MLIDRSKLRLDIKTVSAELRALKAVMRESGQPNVTWKTRADIASAKARATRLCSLMAHSRGRLHQPAKEDKESQAALVARIEAEYAVPEVPAPAVAPPAVPEPVREKSLWQGAKAAVMRHLGMW